MAVAEAFGQPDVGRLEGRLAPVEATPDGEILSKDVMAALGSDDPFGSAKTRIEGKDFPDSLAVLLYSDFTMYLQDDLLTKVDRCTMLASLEARAPFLDHDFAEFVAGIPEWAVSVGGDPKWRIVAAGYVGDSVHETYLSAGWSEIDWHRKGYLNGGYAQEHGRERLYVSPHCRPTEQPTLWGDEL